MIEPIGRSGTTPLPYDPARADRDVLLRLLSVTASLAGLCIAALGFLEAADRSELDHSYADELIALDAFLFVSCVYLILWALRTSVAERARNARHASSTSCSSSR